MTTLHDFTESSIDGAKTPLSAYAGKVALVVNVASKCGLTPQYAGLEALHRELGPQGFVVLGFPCNQFMGQEPGTEAEIAAFCSTKYDVTFPLFAKIDVNGETRDPLYGWLTSVDAAPEGAGDIAWNFGKFLIGRDGAVLARFSPKTAPDAPELRAAIERALA
jgi:glutathione peroxidase